MSAHGGGAGGLVVRAADGRDVAVEVFGDPGGAPVFLLHGTPGSRLGSAPRGPLLYWLGIRLIAFDRPGYGGSDRRPGRSVADVAHDVEAIADALGIEEFAVVGRSGGGPHALACAALLGARTTRAAVLVGLAPRDATGLDWNAGMAASNVQEFSTAAARREQLAAGLEERSRTIRADPARLLAELRPELPEADRRAVADAGIRSMLLRNYAEALRTSPYGWIDDAVALSVDWGFALGDITAPVLFWHGEDDVLSPVAHSRWLAERVPESIVLVEPGAAHFGSLSALPRVLCWAARGHSLSAPGGA